MPPVAWLQNTCRVPTRLDIGFCITYCDTICCLIRHALYLLLLAGNILWCLSSAGLQKQTYRLRFVFVTNSHEEKFRFLMSASSNEFSPASDPHRRVKSTSIRRNECMIFSHVFYATSNYRQPNTRNFEHHQIHLKLKRVRRTKKVI